MSARSHYAELTREQLNATLIDISPVHGGSINSCFLLETDKGNFFLKENNAAAFPGMFEAEKKGLELLKKAGAFIVPEVISIHENNGTSILLMEWLESNNISRDKSAWSDAGKKLAMLHKNTASTFGLDHHNYIGSITQSNTLHTIWSAFFSQERILPQLKRAFDHGKIDTALMKKGENFCAVIEEIFPAVKPSLLHGDLWSGNFFFSNNGPAIFDPAVYYGHREMDLAMTKLFGGFDAAFYDGYEEEFPLEKGWRSRTDLCNLYPLLVHVNLFGGGYVNDVENILRKF